MDDMNSTTPLSCKQWLNGFLDVEISLITLFFNESLQEMPLNVTSFQRIWKEYGRKRTNLLTGSVSIILPIETPLTFTISPGEILAASSVKIPPCPKCGIPASMIPVNKTSSFLFWINWIPKL